MKITDLIPQRPPIVMVDQFLELKESLSWTEFTVKEDNLFVEEGEMSECGIIEHIAQSAAARVGFVYQEKGETVPIGYIGSINHFKINRLPHVGEQLKTSIEMIQEVFNISLVEAKCTVEGIELASCRMKIYLDTNEKKKN